MYESWGRDDGLTSLIVLERLIWKEERKDELVRAIGPVHFYESEYFIVTFATFSWFGLCWLRCPRCLRGLRGVRSLLSLAASVALLGFDYLFSFWYFDQGEAARQPWQIDKGNGISNQVWEHFA